MTISLIRLVQCSLPLCILALGYIGLQYPWEKLSHPRIDAAVHALKKNPQILFMGNSITATLDTVALSQKLDYTVQNVAMEGALPPHWSALLEQGRLRYGITPQKIVIYVSAHNLLSTRLTDESDITLLRLLSPHSVPQLEALSLGEASKNIFPNRISLRNVGLRSLSTIGLRLFWPSACPFIEESIAQQLGSITPMQRPSPATPNIQRQHKTAQEALSLPIEKSILPLLIAQSKTLNAKLIVILPAQSQALPIRCSNPDLPEGVEWILKQGVSVVDLRSIPLSKQNFTSLHHLSPKGAKNIVPWLIKGLNKPSGSLWTAGCP